MQDGDFSARAGTLFYANSHLWTIYYERCQKGTAGQRHEFISVQKPTYGFLDFLQEALAIIR